MSFDGVSNRLTSKGHGEQGKGCAAVKLCAGRGGSGLIMQRSPEVCYGADVPDEAVAVRDKRGESDFL